MNPIVYAVLGFLGNLYFLWALYVFTMGIYRLKLNKNLRGLNKYLAYPIVLLAVIVDFTVNWTLAPILFLDIPREPLVTARLQRYLRHDNGWRYRLAVKICVGMLDMFDPRDKHC